MHFPIVDERSDTPRLAGEGFEANHAVRHATKSKANAENQILISNRLLPSAHRPHRVGVADTAPRHSSW